MHLQHLHSPAPSLGARRPRLRAQPTAPRISASASSDSDRYASAGAAVLEREPQPVHHDGSAPVAGNVPEDVADAAACPVLRALAPVPKNAAAWHQWPLQFTNPRAYYAASIAGRPVAETAFFGMPLVAAGSGEAAKEVLQKELTGDMTVGWPKSFELLLGQEALIHVSGAEHKYIRALMQPALSPEAVARYIPMLQAIAERQLGEWAQQTVARGPVKGVDALSYHAFDVIMQVALGRGAPKQQMERMHALFTNWSAGLFTVAPFDLPFLAFGKAMAAKRQLTRMIAEAVAQERAALADGQPVRGVIGALVTAEQDGVRPTDEQIVSNILLLLWAGKDTTASSLSSALFNLATHPEAMQKLRQEQAEVVAAHGEALTARALRDMWYTEAVIRESMRLRPPVGGIFRKAARDTDIAGHGVRGGSLMIVPIMHLSGQDPRWAGADDVEAFRPERMLTPEGRAQGWQFPFGAGNRICLGAGLSTMQSKVLLALLARNYSMAADTDTEWGRLPLPFPKNGLPLWIGHRRS